MEITKYVLPVVVGAMSGMILITLGENAIHHLYPPPQGFDAYETEWLVRYVQTLPGKAFALMLANYACCSFLAGLVGTLIIRGESIRPALVTGIVMTLAGLYYVVKMPYPTWFAAASMAVYLPLNYAGYLTARKRTKQAAA